MLWLIPSIRHQKPVLFKKDPYNLAGHSDFRLWIFDFRFEGNSLLVDGRPTRGYGEAGAFFSFSMRPFEGDRESKFLEMETKFLESYVFFMDVKDIYTSVQGAHIGSYILNKVLKFVRLTVYFVAEARIQGILGVRNEMEPSRAERRRLFWESFGIEVKDEEHRIYGDLKKIVDSYLKELPDVEEIPLEFLVRGNGFSFKK